MNELVSRLSQQLKPDIDRLDDPTRAVVMRQQAHLAVGQ